MIWTEIQPAGAVDKGWTASASDERGITIVVICNLVNNGQVYLSKDGGATWAQILSTLGDQNWRCCAVSGDGKYIIVASQFTLPLSGRVYMSSDSGTTFAEIRPIGNIDKWWSSVALSADGQVQLIGSLNDYIYVSLDYGITWTKCYPTKV